MRRPCIRLPDGQLGTATIDEVTFSRQIGARTGGLGVSTWRSSMPANPAEMAAYLMLRGKATAEGADNLMALSTQMLTAIDLDQPRCDRAVLPHLASPHLTSPRFTLPSWPRLPIRMP